MSTVIRDPLAADLAGAWPETPWLLEQAARARPAAIASAAAFQGKPAILPRGAPVREQLESTFGVLFRLVCAITAALGLDVAT
jgi:hypothetical protein